jgi:hypothetical protein
MTYSIGERKGRKEEKGEEMRGREKRGGEGRREGKIIGKKISNRERRKEL